MKKLPFDDWTASDGLVLEPNAFEVAKSNYNALVLAGPGAGKTELLAQRAGFLLQTDICKYPAKILAISFKKDAASNLKERVLMRYGEELSRRFDSYTFDAFSVNLLMRFNNGLPERYRFNGQPEVVLSDNPVLDEFKYHAPDIFNSNQKEKLLSFFYQKLPQNIDNDNQRLRESIWKTILSKPNPKLPLKMIMRLANLVLDNNPIIRNYLRQTYHYVFLDEFQDTTYIQYDFLNTCFIGGNAILTAVGDDKQRIMVWAGAKPTAFEDFMSETGATKVPLFMNFRSAPRLVALQNYFVEHLLGKSDKAEAAKHWKIEDGECFIWEYQNQQDEAEHLFTNVSGWLKNEGLSPRDICILVKQTPDICAKNIIAYFNDHGIKVRNEVDLQNLITEELTLFISSMLYSAISNKYSNERMKVVEQMKLFTGITDDNDLLNLEVSISKFQKRIQPDLLRKDLAENDVKKIISDVVDFSGERQIKAVYIEYKDDAYFEYIKKSFGDLLFGEYEKSKSLESALESALGKDSIPIMTVHKSKGLEYHTIIFVGLEDSAFWNYTKQPDEDKCTFFVALSRAKKRIGFTFSHKRADKFNRVQNQFSYNIQEIFDGLENSGIAIREII